MFTLLCSSSFGSRGSELHTGADSNTSLSQPASASIFAREPYLDEHIIEADDHSRVCKKVRASHWLASRFEGEQQLATDNEHIKWASLPHHILWEILEQLQWKRTGPFRRVCKEWQEAHDGMVPSLNLTVPSPLLPYRLQTKTSFTRVTDLNLHCNDISSRLVEGALRSLSGLRRLNLANNYSLIFPNFDTLGPALTGLTYLSLSHTDVGDGQLARLIPFLPSLTELDTQGCADFTLEPRFYVRPRNSLASLTALTRLDLSYTRVCDQGMELLAPLTALTRLDLDHTAVSDQGLNFMAPLAAGLTHLVLGGEYSTYGDPEMMAVSSLTALTRLEMLYGGDDVEFVSEEGLEALCSLTGLVHLELNLRNFDNSDESWRALSSLTALSHLNLTTYAFSDAGAKAMACLTALTHLDLGCIQEFDRNPSEFDVSDEGARALATLVRLTCLNLSSSQLSEKGLGALCSLTALTDLDLSRVYLYSDSSPSTVFLEVVGALCSFPSLSKLLLGDANFSLEELSTLKNSLNSSVSLCC
jgi:Leucine-rich repeat (LRR) protein